MVNDWLQANISISYKIFASIGRQCQYSESPQPKFFSSSSWMERWGTIHASRSWNATCMITSGNREILLCGPDLLWQGSWRFTPHSRTIRWLPSHIFEIWNNPHVHCRIFHSSKFPLIPFIVPRTLMRILNNTFVFHEQAKLCSSGKKTYNVLGSRFIVGSAFTTIADNSFTDFFGINNRNSYGWVKAPLRL